MNSETEIIPVGCIEYEQPIKTCPFCGGRAMMKKTRRWPGKNSIDGYTVVCVNYKCLIYDADNSYSRTEKAALKRWETRVE